MLFWVTFEQNIGEPRTWPPVQFYLYRAGLIPHLVSRAPQTNYFQKFTSLACGVLGFWGFGVGGSGNVFGYLGIWVLCKHFFLIICLIINKNWKKLIYIHIYINK